MHCLTASVAYVTTFTYASTNDQWARPLAYRSVRQKRNRVSSVQLRRPVRALRRSSLDVAKASKKILQS